MGNQRAIKYPIYVADFLILEREAVGPPAPTPLTAQSFFSIFKFLFIKLFFGCPGSLFLCAGFLSCSNQGLLFVVLYGFLTSVASLVCGT